MDGGPEPRSHTPLNFAASIPRQSCLPGNRSFLPDAGCPACRVGQDQGEAALAGPFPSSDITVTPEEESLALCLAEPPQPTRGPHSPKLPVQRQLWVRGCGLVWWLSRICCTSCSTEKPELLFPLVQVHLMPWTGGRGRVVRGCVVQGGAGQGGA